MPIYTYISSRIYTRYIYRIAYINRKKEDKLLKEYTEKATNTANAINAASPNRAIAVTGDILDDAYIESLVKKAAEFGNGKIHVIVNNAGFTWDGVIHKVCFLSLPFFLDDIYIYIYIYVYVFV